MSFTRRKTWYSVRIAPYRDEQVKRVIVTHENITKILEVQEALQEKESELSLERGKLEETNIALRVLLRKKLGVTNTSKNLHSFLMSLE